MNKSSYKMFLRKLKRNIASFKRRGKNFNILLATTFFSGVLLLAATYAWFYATLDVKIEFIKLTVSNNTGLFISLDGIDYSSTIDISKDSIITNLTSKYPNQNNQWAGAGLFPVSSNGISSPDNPWFDMFSGSGKGESKEDTRIEAEYDRCVDACNPVCSKLESDEAELTCFNQCVYKCDDERSYFGTEVQLDAAQLLETRTNSASLYVAFDFFLKNVSGSPKSDNLYFDDGTSVMYNSEKYNDDDGVINSIRIGFVKIGSVTLKSSTDSIQGIACNNKCEMVIYEPNSTKHSDGSIHRATKRKIDLVDGIYIPTYAVIKEGKGLELANGHEGTGIPLDIEHFSKQNTIKEEDFSKPIFEIPNAVTKMRAYVWIEGQDIDSLETSSNGGSINLNINLIKDLAGYY